MIDTRTIIRESLDLLKPRLHAYELSALQRSYGSSLTTREPRLAGMASPDVQALLSIFLDHWNGVFAKQLKPADRALAHELKSARNLWAHEQPVTFDQAYRTVDSVQLLLGSLGANDVRETLERTKARMRRAQIELDDEEQATVPAQPVVSTAVSSTTDNDYWTGLSRQINAVFAADPQLKDHRRSHRWLTGALGNPASRVWFVGENPSLGMVERASDPTGGPLTPEAQWWASRGDRLFRELLVKHGFKSSPPEAPGGWRCYITNAIKEADYASNWRGAPAERHARAAEAWAPVLQWEIEQSRPILNVALGQTVTRLLGAMAHIGVSLPRVETIQHYSYVAHRPQGSLGPMHPDRIRAYDEEFARIAALLALGEHSLRGGQPGLANGAGGAREIDQEASTAATHLDRERRPGSHVRPATWGRSASVHAI